jgi:glycosyltransferase involved in cell wall biosynthesis
MPMKILEIISAGYVAGGAENAIVKISPYLLNKGYSIKTLASDLGADKKHFNEYVFKSVNSSSPLKALLFLFNPYSFLMLKKVLKEYRPDVVHLHTMGQITPSALFLLKNHPTVMTLHGPESFLHELLIWCLRPSYFKHHGYDKKDLNIAGRLTYFYFNSLQKFLYRFGLKNVDIFIAPSQYMQNVAKIDVAPVVHLPNFIELQQFHELTNNYNLLFVGRLEKMKGVEILIQAISFVIKVFPQTTLTIVGDGCSKSDLFDLTKKLQLERSIDFRGWVEHKDLDGYYEKASIVVVPSICPENFPTVCNEAMSAGRPVIGTRVGGIPEIIDDGVNGYLVETENPEQIATNVVKLFSEENLLKEFGRNARKKAQEFSLEKHVANLEKVYEEVIQKYKGRSKNKPPLVNLFWTKISH